MRRIPAFVSRFSFAAAAAACLLAGRAPALEPLFAPVKIDGPKHEPARQVFWYGPFSEGCALLDVNGDGKLDITSGANWYEAPDWKKHENYREGAGVAGEFVSNNGEAALDVNGDGKTDLVSSGWMRNGVYWYENPGKAGEKWKETKICDSESTEGFIAEDIDGDKDVDILINHWGPNPNQGVTWIENLGGAKFAVHVIGKEGDTHGIGLGDLDGDGRKDIITPDGWWKAPTKPASDAWKFHADWKHRSEMGIRIIVHDVNEDGKQDVIYGHGHNYGLYWMEQTGPNAGTGGFAFKEHTIEDSFGQFHTLVMADVNADGRLDLLTGKRLRGHGPDDPSSFDPLCVFWYEIEKGEFKRRILSFNHGAHFPGKDERNPIPTIAIGTGMNINVADANGDGLADVLVAGKSGIYLFENRGLPPTKRMQ